MLFPFLFSLRKWLMNQVILQDWLHSRNRRRRMVVIWFLCLIMHWRRRMEVVLRRSMFLQNICGISFYLIKSLQRHWHSVWKSRTKSLIFNCKHRNLMKLPKSTIFAQSFNSSEIFLVVFKHCDLRYAIYCLKIVFYQNLRNLRSVEFEFSRQKQYCSQIRPYRLFFKHYEIGLTGWWL